MSNSRHVADQGTQPDFLRGSPRLEDAYALAARAHRNQTRKDGVSPYVGHPLAVARELSAAGLDEATLAAALLHDVVEDSSLGIDAVVRRFGVEIGELVSAMTDDETIEDYAERKREHRGRVEAAGPRAASIYAADKLVNVRDLRRLYAEMGEAAAGRFNAPLDLRVRLWREDLRMLDRLVGDLSVVAELRSELDAFAGERPGAVPADVA